MLDVKVFTTREELMELTGLKSSDDLWKAGFNLDDWDIGFQMNEKIHKIYDDDPEEIVSDWNSPYHWLMDRMVSYCTGPSYLQYKGKHYYLVHHS